jgi:radical SAM superfamily enzyme YgiQ (UPF0313 family)
VPVTSIPRPRRDLVDRSKYFCIWTHSDTRKLKTAFPRVASMRTSLGCPFSCSFCAIHFMMNRAYLQRTPEDVVDEIASIQEEHIYFVDDEMFINIERVTRIAELLKERGLAKKYVSWARSDTVVRHPELFALWKSVGLEIVYIGFESMDESRLKEYSKKTVPETNRKAAEVLHACGITLHAAFIVHPDFDEDDFARLEKEVVKLCPAEVTFTVLSPSPGTPLWDEHRAHFICDPFANYDCFHTIIPTKMSLQKFYRAFGKLNAQALRYNPLRMHGIKAPLKDFIRAFVGGIRYITGLFMLYKDYPASMWLAKGDEQLTRAKEAGTAYE